MWELSPAEIKEDWTERLARLPPIPGRGVVLQSSWLHRWHLPSRQDSLGWQTQDQLSAGHHLLQVASQPQTCWWFCSLFSVASDIAWKNCCQRRFLLILSVLPTSQPNCVGGGKTWWTSLIQPLFLEMATDIKTLQRTMWSRGGGASWQSDLGLWNSEVLHAGVWVATENPYMTQNRVNWVKTCLLSWAVASLNPCHFSAHKGHWMNYFGSPGT
jgi:hypothetical protein